jgi:hypothetical protein
VIFGWFARWELRHQEATLYEVRWWAVQSVREIARVLRESRRGSQKKSARHRPLKSRGHEEVTKQARSGVNGKNTLMAM